MGTCAVVVTQELKSQQQQLPAAVASIIQQHGWDTCCTTACHLPDVTGTEAARAAAAGLQAEQAARQHQEQLPQHLHSSFHSPGFTITSFHLQQLQASKQVGMLQPPSAIDYGDATLGSSQEATDLPRNSCQPGACQTSAPVGQHGHHFLSVTSLGCKSARQSELGVALLFVGLNLLHDLANFDINYLSIHNSVAWIRQRCR